MNCPRQGVLRAPGPQWILLCLATFSLVLKTTRRCPQSVCDGKDCQRMRILLPSRPHLLPIGAESSRRNVLQELAGQIFMSSRSKLAKVCVTSEDLPFQIFVFLFSL